MVEIRVKGSCVSQPRRSRWLISAVLLLAVIGFVGFSMLPLISGAFKNQPATEATPVNTPTQSANQKLQLEQAARGYEAVLQREPDNQTALRGLVEARFGLQDFKGMVTPLEKLAQLNPQQTQYTLWLAQVKQLQGDLSGASAAYRAVLATSPGEIQALQGLVKVLVQEKRPTEAIALLENTLATANQANQNQPNSVDLSSVRLLLAQTYTTQQNYDQAIAIYNDLIKNDKQDFRPVLEKALVLQQQGKTAQAKPLFDNAAALAPAQYKQLIKQAAAAAASGGVRDLGEAKQ